MISTNVNNDGIKIPVVDNAFNQRRFQAEDQILKHSLLERLFQPSDLLSLLVVKIPLPDQLQEIDPLWLKGQDFGDGIKRQILFSSGNNHYFGDRTLFQQIKQLFQTEPDTACRYGSLLVSDCYMGAETFENLKVKIVDFEDPEFEKFRTGDCHGKISPRLARQLGGKRHCPFQFRFAWMNQWSENDRTSPGVSFLAKGTFLPDAELTDAQGYELILDRSSIKGIKKSKLPDLIPCGDYDFPKVVMGNRGNAKATEYDSSWQFHIWYSEKALQNDLVPITRQKAEQLATLQRDPLALARHIVQEYDKKQARLQQVSEETDSSGVNEAGASDQDTAQESRMIAVLRNDLYGELISHPKVVDFLRNYTAGQWQELAIKSGYTHRSGMALPAPQLERGTVCVPHLPEGDILLTRYPIVSQDNIRIYRNQHHPELIKTKHVVWIHPQDVEAYHQGDFDGDQLVVSSVADLPHLAQETLRAGESGRYVPVVQRPKLSYTQILDDQGNPKYTKLYQIAVASSQNKVGRVANMIGRVQVAVPNEGEDFKTFTQQKKRFLDRLMVCLQTEVDYQKNAERMEDLKIVELPSGKKLAVNGATLLKECQQWTTQHPAPFFDFKKDMRLYRTFSMPANERIPLNVIPREVNCCWEPVRIRQRERHEFRYLFSHLPAHDVSEADRRDTIQAWAEDLKLRYEAARQDIQQSVGSDQKAFFTALAKLHETYRAEIHEQFPTPASKRDAMIALWQTQHTRSDVDGQIKAGLNLAKQLPVTFELVEAFQFPSEATPRNAYVLSVPFGDRALHWKTKLDSANLRYDAIVHPSLPIVEFAFKQISDKNLAFFDRKFGNHSLDLDTIAIPDHLRIIAPPDHWWAEPAVETTGKAALVFNLCADTIAAELRDRSIEQIKLLGVKHNDFGQENFSRKQWRKPIILEVGTLDLELSNPYYYRYHGTPIVQLDGKNLGTFAPETAKLPMGTTFEALLEPSDSSLVLHIAPGSIQLPQIEQSSEANNHHAADHLKAQLLKIVQATYDQERSTQSNGVVKFPLGDWIAFVRSDGDFTLRNHFQQTLFKTNLRTGEELISLSTETEVELRNAIGKLDSAASKAIEKRDMELD